MRNMLYTDITSWTWQALVVEPCEQNGERVEDTHVGSF